MLNIRINIDNGRKMFVILMRIIHVYALTLFQYNCKYFASKTKTIPRMLYISLEIISSEICRFQITLNRDKKLGHF